jgi:hypothetical protein
MFPVGRQVINMLDPLPLSSILNKIKLDKYLIIIAKKLIVLCNS